MDRSKHEARMRRGVVELRHRFAQGMQGVFSGILSTQEIVDVIKATVGEYRDRHYAPLTTLRLYIEQVLSEDQACQDVVGRRLSERVASGESATRGSTVHP